MNKSRIISLLLTFYLIFSLIVGCTNSNSTGNNEKKLNVNESDHSVGELHEEKIVKLDILGSTDFAGALEASEYYSGAAKFAAYMKHYEKQNPEGTLLLDAGDAVVGTPLSNLCKGKPVIEVMNTIGYDAMAVGNHEFDWGIETVLDSFNIAKFPLLSANIYSRSDGKRVEWAKPYIIVEKVGVKVGILGLITKETPRITKVECVEPFEFKDPIEEANKLIPQMKDDGAEVVVVLSHLPAYKESNSDSFTGEVIDLANQVTGVDAIIAGHNFDPMAIKIKDIPIVQTTHSGSMIGHITLNYDVNNKKVISSKAELIPVFEGNLDIQSLAEVDAIVNEYGKELNKVFAEQIGTATENLEIDYVKEFSIGNWMTDSIRQATGVQIAFINSSGIFETINAGPITIGKVYQISPFENKLVKSVMTGKEIKELFEITLDSSRIREMGGLQISGMNLVYDSSKPDYEKTIEMTLSDGTIMEMGKKYTVATIDFLAGGGNAYENLTKVTWQDTGLQARDTFVGFLKNKKELSNKTEGRIIDVIKK